MVDRSLANILKALGRGQPKRWDDELAHVELAYSKPKKKTSQMSPFNIIYGANPTNMTDLIPMPKMGKLGDHVKNLIAHI